MGIKKGPEVKKHSEQLEEQPADAQRSIFVFSLIVLKVFVMHSCQIYFPLIKSCMYLLNCLLFV